VINAFEGDALLAFFGILPRPMTPEESAYRAVRAAVGMLNIIQRLNHRRIQRGDPAFDTGIVINSGKVTAGTLGAADRLHYTVIGDTVNSTHRLQSIARTFGESGVAISGGTYEALGDRRNDFKLERLGAYTVKGKSERLVVYRLLTDNAANPPRGAPDV
jgi:adenylate cyclase